MQIDEVGVAQQAPPPPLLELNCNKKVIFSYSSQSTSRWLPSPQPVPS
jgi:hypothetical protein